MRFQKRQVHTKTTPKFLPVIPLLPTKLSSDGLNDKAAYITFTLQVSKGLAPGTSKSELLWEPLFTPDLSTFLIGITKLKLS
jgi:hypothetical protein